MKKRLLALLTLLLMLLPDLASAGASAQLNQKMATRSGPGTQYTEELGTLPQDTPVTVIAQVETNGTVWCHVEFYYNGQLHRAYTGKKRLNFFGSVPTEKGTYTEDATLSQATVYYGPGVNYAARRKTVPANMALRVFQVEGEWALCDYKEGNQWIRGYIHVDSLRQTTAAVSVQVPSASGALTDNIIDPDRKLCVDYYGAAVSYAGHTENCAKLIGYLPVMKYFDGVPCIRSHTEVYTGPGTRYWQRYNYSTHTYSYTGRNDTNLRIYGKENGWIMIRYPSDANGGYRYGWVIPQAISVENQNRTPAFEIARGLTAVTTQMADVTDDPDRSLEKIGPTMNPGEKVKPLAFLDTSYSWVYCEYTYNEGNSQTVIRGFVPAESLRLE